MINCKKAYVCKVSTWVLETGNQIYLVLYLVVNSVAAVRLAANRLAETAAFAGSGLWLFES